MICYCANPQCQKYGCKQWADIKPPSNFIGYTHPVQTQTGSRPHKCPICDGAGELFSLSEYKNLPCKACIKGIIWG